MLTCNWTDVGSICLAQVVCGIKLVDRQGHGRGQVRGCRRNGRRGAFVGQSAGRPRGRGVEVSGGSAGQRKGRAEIGDLTGNGALVRGSLK